MTDDRLLQDRLALTLSKFAAAVWGDGRLPADVRVSLEAMYHNDVKPALDEYRVLQARTCLPFEVTLPGFDGGTDETDDRVLWVSAPSLEFVRDLVAGLGAKVDTMYPVPAGEINYVLPLQADELRARIAAAPAATHTEEEVPEGMRP